MQKIIWKCNFYFYCLYFNYLLLIVSKVNIENKWIRCKIKCYRFFVIINNKIYDLYYTSHLYWKKVFLQTYVSNAVNSGSEHLAIPLNIKEPHTYSPKHQNHAKHAFTSLLNTLAPELEPHVYAHSTTPSEIESVSRRASSAVLKRRAFYF